MGLISHYDVFLSHGHRQRPWVRQVVSLLRERGLKVFFDEDSISLGDDFVLALERAIDSSEILVLVLSRSSLFSKWVAFETAQRIYEDVNTPHRRLIPILVEPVDKTLVRSAVRRLETVDLTDPVTRESEFRHFLKSLGLSDASSVQLPPWPEPSGIEELHIADVGDVIEWNWIAEQLLEKLIALDYELLNQLTDEHEGHVAQWSPVFWDHPDTWRLLITPAHEIVGYWHFVPLFDDTLQLAIQGRLRDAEITTDKVRVFEFPGSYSIYFVSFGLLSRFRRTKGYMLLLNSLFDVLLDLAKNQIFIDKVCANAFSPSGDSLCKTFQMTCVGPHAEHGTIYLTTVASVLRLAVCQNYREYKELVALYSAHLGLFGDDQQV